MPVNTAVRAVVRSPGKAAPLGCCVSEYCKCVHVFYSHVYSGIIFGSGSAVHFAASPPKIGGDDLRRLCFERYLRPGSDLAPDI